MAKKQKILVLLDSGVYPGDLAIVKARLGERVFNESVKLFNLHHFIGGAGVDRPIGDFAVDLLEQVGTEGKEIGGVVGCTYLTNSLVRQLEDGFIPKDAISVIALSGYEDDPNGNVGTDLARLCGQLHRASKGAEFIEGGGGHTRVSKIIEDKILKIRPDITPRNIGINEAKRIYYEGVRQSIDRHNIEIGR